MAGYCTHCNGSGYRNPTKEREREGRLMKFIYEIADLETLDTEFEAEEGCDKLNALIARARRITGKQDHG